VNRFLLAAALALIVHGLLFALGPRMTGVRPPAPPRSLTMTFSTKKAAPEPDPAPEAGPTDPAPAPEAVVADTEKRPKETVAPKPPPADEKVVRPPETPTPTEIKAPDKPRPEPEAKPRKQAVTPPPKQAPKPKEKREPRPQAPARPRTEDVKKSEARPAPPSVSEPAPAAPADEGKGNTAGFLSGFPGLTDHAASGPGEEAATPPPVEEIIRAVPAYRDNPRPEYPRMARRRGYEGTVMLEVLVNKAGKVEDLRIVESSGYDALDKSATRAVKVWLFEPGTIGGRKVEMWVRVPVRFELN
jgi:periplasmic protein TonB